MGIGGDPHQQKRRNDVQERRRAMWSDLWSSRACRGSFWEDLRVTGLAAPVVRKKKGVGFHPETASGGAGLLLLRRQGQNVLGSVRGRRENPFYSQEFLHGDLVGRPSLACAW